jgi:hypothetical protein
MINRKGQFQIYNVEVKLVEHIDCVDHIKYIMERNVLFR